MKATNDKIANKECYDILRALMRKIDRMEEQLTKIQLHISTKDRSPWLTVDEAAAYCGYSRSTFYGKYKDEIPHHQRDTRIMFNVSDLEAWMKKNVKTPESW